MALTTLEQWRMLKAVIDHGGFAPAAAAIFKSQSSIHHAVRKLEQQLDVPLLVVRGRKVFPTEAGSMLLRRANHVLEGAASLEAIADSLGQGVEAEVRIAVDEIYPPAALACALEEFAGEYPNTRVQLLETVLSGGAERLLAGEADLLVAGSVPPEDYLALLNSYFECTAGAVLANGGEVLLLIGDAVLAIFPVQAGEEAACAAALRAARDARTRLAALNQTRNAAGAAPLALGIGLHLGALMFGNIGVPERLQFTVTGPAANEVARLEALTKTLERPVLASAAFAERLPHAWKSLGMHDLRGVEGAREIFAPPD